MRMRGGWRCFKIFLLSSFNIIGFECLKIKCRKLQPIQINSQDNGTQTETDLQQLKIDEMFLFYNSKISYQFLLKDFLLLAYFILTYNPFTENLLRVNFNYSETSLTFLSLLQKDRAQTKAPAVLNNIYSTYHVG